MTKKFNEPSTSPISEVSGFHLDASRSYGGMTLIFDGIIGIEDFSLEKVELRSHDGRVFVSGKRLKVSIFENKAVELSGRVEGVAFGYGKN